MLAAANTSQLNVPNFSGTWTLDLQESNSIDPLMKQIGASVLDRTYVTWARFKATFSQTDDVLRIATRGPAFALDQTLYLDGRTYPDNLEIFGATSVKARATWSEDHKELFETHQIRTKQGRGGQLVIERSLTNQGYTLTVTIMLRLDNEPGETAARQIWHKED